MKKFGLRHTITKELMGFSVRSTHPGEFCVDVEFSLHPNEIPWLVDTFEKANHARNSTSWYNASYDTPRHNYQPNELEVVEFLLTETA